MQALLLIVGAQDTSSELACERIHGTCTILFEERSVLNGFNAVGNPHAGLLSIV